ncbi:MULTISPECIES: single-stranded DNA-binding protein [Trichocoleus]|uniref:Single-stranded DNA-binding protein n=1 Tax=Trichocoleus desertorum GB2-A4 TaxID=2933944 RepID=A0ABV0J3W9_9CYAN|nr:single-stranded DNA-binding protein [Trichocoleus sp. FACHB-46]MBD1860552.1 single-stranded DNA-binding protein [Trichocoleus sp. FACHB-46]
MNSCILMAEIIQDPQLRYTSDTQTPITEMIVQFSGLRADDPPATLKVVGWGNLAQEIQERYHQGDRVVIEGRLNMNTIERPEGFKEKRAELTVQRIHSLDGSSSSAAVPAATTTARVAPAPAAARTPAATTANRAAPAVSTPDAAPRAATKSKPPAPPVAEPDYDDIPF